MKTAEYVKQFKLDKPNYNFNREKFMEAFGQEFKDRIEAMITACKKMQVQFTYEKFLHAIKEQQDKFWQISNKKIGEPFIRWIILSILCPSCNTSQGKPIP